MREFEHSPAPWVINKNRSISSIDERGDHVCDYYAPEEMVADGVIGERDDIAEANAHLIAAAPEMLEELEYLLSDEYLYAIGSDEDSERSIVYCAHKSAKKVIAKAKGITPNYRLPKGLEEAAEGFMSLSVREDKAKALDEAISFIKQWIGDPLCEGDTKSEEVGSLEYLLGLLERVKKGDNE